jgi:glutathione S-transferase
MITLYSYPELFGLADNNPFGLKVFAFLRLAGLEFRHEHIFDASKAPRGQLPYIEEDGETVGDSDTIVAHLKEKHRLAIDADLGAADRDTTHLVSRMLDDLYWVMSYSRWRDDRFWPLFRDAILTTHPQVTPEGMETARAYNFERYRYQGIGRYEPADAYKRGLADLQVLAHLIGETGFVFAATPSSIDAAIYGFLANIWYYPIPTPLKAFLTERPHLTGYIERVHAAVMR